MLRIHFHSCDEYEKGDKKNQGHLTLCSESATNNPKSILNIPWHIINISMKNVMFK